MSTRVTLTHGHDGGPESPYREICVGAPITRVPVGEQRGLPSWIDHCASDGTVNSLRLSWIDVPADHAALIAHCRVNFQTRRPFRRKTWVYSDLQTARDYTKSNAPASFTSLLDFHTFVASVQEAHSSPDSCAIRRRQREPPAIKQLRMQLRSASTIKERRRLQKLIWEGRKHWLDTLRRIRQSKSFAIGRPIWRSKKLHDVTCMRAHEEAADIYDHSEWNRLVQSEYMKKWKCEDLHYRSIILDQLNAGNGCGISISSSDITAATKRMRRQRALDHYGICILAVNVVVDAAPELVADLFSRVIADRKALEEIIINGRAKAKSHGAICAHKVRVILPLPVGLGIIDVILSTMLHAVIDESASKVGYGFLECAKSKRQVMDIAFPASLLIEKGLDIGSELCLAQADVKQYYDHLRPLQILRWMLQRNMPRELAFSLFRFQLCPEVHLRVGSETTHLRNRCIGSLTGSRSASAAGRIPLLDAAESRLEEWKKHCFRVDNHCLALATFVDNLLTTGSSPEAATYILDDCENCLERVWFLKFGEDSREFMVCRGYDLPIRVDERWPQKTTMRCLGHYLDDDAGISSCFQKSTSAMWRGFFGNLSAGLLASSEQTKLRFLNSCIASIPAFRWARWPYQASYADRLDRLQRHMIGTLMQCKPKANESFEDFSRRRHIFCGKLASKHGRWSQQWAQSLRNWSAHVDSQHDPGSWSCPIVNWHDEIWLASRRFWRSSLGESRTQTRRYRGKVHKRWEASLVALP